MTDPKAAQRTPNRRELLVGTGLAIGSVAVPTASADHPAPGAAPAKAFDFAQNPPRRRKSFADLTDDELRAYCLAISYMRNGSGEKPLTMSSPVQWDQYVMIHAHHCTEAGQFQVHWSWFFLPWHRAYLYFMERQLAHILTTVFKLDGNKFALPYWDWETHKEIPNTRERTTQRKPSPFFGYDLTIDSLSDPLEYKGQSFDNLALWDGYRGPTLEKPQMSPENETGPVWKQHIQLTARYTNPAYIGSILQLPWSEFGGAEVTSKDDGQGALEQNPHNLMHDWVGSRFGSNRDMGTLRYAALDPLFYLHHANLDRIWSLYPYTPDPATKPAWANQSFTFTDVDGKPISVTVSDVLKRMNTISYAPPESPSPGTRVMLESIPNFPKEPPKPTSDTLLDQPITVTDKPVTTKVPAPKPGLKALLTRGAGKKPVLAILEFDVGSLAYLGRFSVRIFVNKPDATATTDVTDKHFVGMISAMDSHAGHRPDGDKVSHKFRVNVTQGVNDFFQLVQPGEAFDLTLVPVETKDLKHLRLTVKSVTLRLYE